MNVKVRHLQQSISSGSAPTGPQFVQSAVNTSDLFGGTITAALSATTGNLIVVGVEWVANPVTLPVGSVTDSMGNTYNIIAASLATQANGFLQIAFAANITGDPSLVITVNFAPDAPAFRRIIVLEYSGMHANPDDGTGNVGGGNGTALTTGSFTPTTVNNIVAMFCSNNDGTTTVFSSTDYAMRVLALVNDTGAGDRIGAPAVAQTADVTASVSSDWRITARTFRGA